MMKALMRCFLMFLRQILSDRMLFMVLAAPVLAGFAFRFGVPVAETLLCEALGKPVVLLAVARLFDLFLLVMTPYIICFASAMVILSEMDEGLSAYLAVTPVGKRGYLVSRLVFPAILALPATWIVATVFSLAPWKTGILVPAILLSGLLSLIVTLLVVAYANNRVEGMALAKLSGIVLLGLPVPFFIGGGAQWLFSPLPSFWIAKFVLYAQAWPYLPLSAATCMLWVWALSGRFLRKLS